MENKNKKIVDENLKCFLKRFQVNQKPIEESREQKIRQGISEKYSLEDEIALINNYNMFLLDKTLTKYEEEYLDYLQYRQTIKEEC